jgi:hypothetical protein
LIGSNKNVDAWFAAQKANSNQIITYADEKGYLVKAVLNPERYGHMIAESRFLNRSATARIKIE